MANAKDIINRSTFRTIYAPEVKQTITVSVDGYKWNDDDSKELYAAIKAADKYEQTNFVWDIIGRYCKENDIKWGCMDNPRVTIYDGPNGGHAVIKADISPAIGHEFEFAASCTAILLENHKSR